MKSCPNCHSENVETQDGMNWFCRVCNRIWVHVEGIIEI